MYLDAVVIAGIVAVLMVLGFFVGVGIFVVRDQKEHAQQGQKKGKHGNKPI